MKKIWLLFISLYFFINFSNAEEFVLHTAAELENYHASSDIFAGNDNKYHYYTCKVQGCTKVFEAQHKASDVFVKYDEGEKESHYYKCNEEKCNALVAHRHNFDNQPYHSKFCKVCTDKGKCDKRFKGDFSSDLNGKHWQFCSDPNCLAIKSAYHTGGTHENGGICEDYCKATYQTHGMNNANGTYQKDAENQGYNSEYHWNSCYFDGCTYKYYQEHVKSGMPHSDAYRHWYLCTVCGIELNSTKHEWTEYFEFNKASHWIDCESCGFQRLNEAHIPDNNENSCEVCREKPEYYEDKQIDSFELSSTYVTKKFKDTFTLTIKNKKPIDTVTETFTWSSSNTEVATVDANGKVTVGNEVPGSTIITATAINGVKAECIVYVGEGIKINGLLGLKTIKVGDIIALTPTFTNHGIAINESDYLVDYSALEWSTTGSNIKLIEGLVKALEPSLTTTKVTVTMPGGGSASINIKVNCRDGEHEGGEEHSSSGDCTKCGVHYIDHKVGDWKFDEDGHWKECSGCGEQESYGEHYGATHDKGGKCTKCKYEYEEHGESEEWIKYDGKQHYAECINPDCSVKTYENHTEGPVCKKCGYVAECKHEGVSHATNGKCPTCGVQIEPQHTFNNWKYKNDREHSRTCSVRGCNVEETAAHQFDSSGFCSICNYTGGGECQHVWLYGNPRPSTHDKQCENCGTQVTREPHSFVNGKCVCGEKSDTDGHNCDGYQANLQHDDKKCWYQCPDPTCNKRWFEEEHDYPEGEVICARCGYNKNTQGIELNYDLRLNVYQTEYYIDKKWEDGENGKTFTYIPIEIPLDIVGKAKIKDITVTSEAYDLNYVYYSRSGKATGNATKTPWLKISLIEKTDTEPYKLKAELTDPTTAKYFNDYVIIKVEDEYQKDEARVRIIKSGDERARFHANALYPVQSICSVGNDISFTIHARTNYLYGNSTEEEIAEFKSLDKTKLARYVVDDKDIKITVNNTGINASSEPIIGNITKTCTLVPNETGELYDGFPYYEIKVTGNGINPGTAKVVVSITGKYQEMDKENISNTDFVQVRNVPISVQVFGDPEPVHFEDNSSSGGSSGGNSGNGSGNNGGESTTTGGGTGVGGVIGGTLAGLGAVGLLVLFIILKKSSGH